MFAVFAVYTAVFVVNVLWTGQSRDHVVAGVTAWLFSLLSVDSDAGLVTDNVFLEL